jgi:hypothetical protein
LVLEAEVAGGQIARMIRLAPFNLFPGNAECYTFMLLKPDVVSLIKSLVLVHFFWFFPLSHSARNICKENPRFLMASCHWAQNHPLICKPVLKVHELGFVKDTDTFLYDG